jgi:excinuclease ABC subunit A
MHGFDDDLNLPWRQNDRPFEGVMDTLKRRLEGAESDEQREKLEAYQSDRVCPDCNGTRLREESRVVTVSGKTIVEVMEMSVRDSLSFFKSLREEDVLSEADKRAMKDVLKEIVKRLGFLNDVGLDYLTLDRPSSSLSGGEMQRIRLATQIGSGLTGVLYVLDEPTIGLHPRDNERLITMLKALKDRGNTVVVVEHDEEMMRGADWIIDMGPGAGREGGQVVYQGDFKNLLTAKTLTSDYLSGRKKVSSSQTRMKGNGKHIVISGCSEHNLKNITVKIPLGTFTVVTGVSGSGKSTLIEETLKCELMRQLHNSKCKPGKFKKITGVSPANYRREHS